MSDNNVKNVMDSTIEKIRTMVDVNTIIGSPLKVDDITLIPVSKVSFGVATGGSDFPSKTSGQLFGGGGGAGVSIIPIAFIAVNGDNVRMLPVYNDLGSMEKAINMAPELLEKVKGLFSKNKEVK